MQISKTLLVVCVTTACVGSLSLQAAESDDLAKARQALEKKMSELQSPAPQAPQTPPAAVPAVETIKIIPPLAPAPAPAPAPAAVKAAEPSAPMASPADPAAIAKARAAIEEKVSQLNTQPATPAAVTPKAAVAAPAPAVVTPPPVVKQPVATVMAASQAANAQPAPPTTPLIPPADPVAVAKARAALSEKMKELDAQQATATVVRTNPPVAVKPVDVKPSVKADEPKIQTPVPAAVVPPVMGATPADTEAIAKARAAVNAKMKQLDAQQAAPVAPRPVVAAPAGATSPTAVNTTVQPTAPAGSAEAEAAALAREAERQRLMAAERAGQSAAKGALPKNLAFPPMEAPPLPISPEKAARLQELTSKYRADQLTPEQYQAERAKLLAEP